MRRKERVEKLRLAAETIAGREGMRNFTCHAIRYKAGRTEQISYARIMSPVKNRDIRPSDIYFAVGSWAKATNFRVWLVLMYAAMIESEADIEEE